MNLLKLSVAIAALTMASFQVAQACPEIGNATFNCVDELDEPIGEEEVLKSEIDFTQSEKDGVFTYKLVDTEDEDESYTFITDGKLRSVIDEETEITVTTVDTCSNNEVVRQTELQTPFGVIEYEMKLIKTSETEFEMTMSGMEDGELETDKLVCTKK